LVQIYVIVTEINKEEEEEEEEKVYLLM